MPKVDVVGIARGEGETDMRPRGDTEQIDSGDRSQILHLRIRSWRNLLQEPLNVTGGVGRLVSGDQKTHSATELPNCLDDGMRQ